MNIKSEELEKITNLCNEFKVKNLFAFGSVLRNDFNQDSDIDFSIDFYEKDPIKYTDLYFDFKEKLEKLFGRDVDLIEERAIRNVYFKEILNTTKVRIYG